MYWLSIQTFLDFFFYYWFKWFSSLFFSYYQVCIHSEFWIVFFYYYHRSAMAEILHIQLKIPLHESKREKGERKRVTAAYIYIYTSSIKHLHLRLRSSLSSNKDKLSGSQSSVFFYIFCQNYSRISHHQSFSMIFSCFFLLSYVILAILFCKWPLLMRMREREREKERNACLHRRRV